MSFSGIRTVGDYPSSRAFHFQRILLENNPNGNLEDCMTKIDTTLTKFHLGLLNHPYRDGGQNGTTAIFKLPTSAHDTDRFSPIGLKDVLHKEDFSVYSTVSTVMDFLNDYFGLKSDPLSYRSIKKKYQDAFPFGYLPQSDIPDFAVLIMRAAHDIFMNLDYFEKDQFFCIKISTAWNSLETITIDDGLEIKLGSKYF